MAIDWDVTNWRQREHSKFFCVVFVLILNISEIQEDLSLFP